MTRVARPIACSVLSLAMLALVPAGQALAADPAYIAPSHGPSAGGGLYGALRGGFTRGDTTTFEVNDDALNVGAIETEYDTDALVVGAVGRSFGKLRGEVELSYARYGVDTHTAFAVAVAGAGAGSNIFTEDESFGDASAISLMASAYYDFDLGRFSPFVGVGVGLGQLKAKGFGVTPLDGTLDGGVVLDDEGYGLAYHATVGTSIAMTDKIALEIGYRYQGIEAELDAVNGVESEVELTSHNGFAGVRVGF